jgi:hypothetical protein
MTQLEIVNNVLRRLREDTVGSVNDNAYAQLIAMFVNDGIDELTNSYDWSSLNHSVEVSLAASTRIYDLSALVSGGGNVENTGRATTSESLLRFDAYGRPLAFVFDDNTDSQFNCQLNLITIDEMERVYQLDRSEDTEDPSAMALKLASGGGYELELFPAPNTTRWMRIEFWTPQAELAIDGTDDGTSVIVDSKAVEAYAHYRAANERGEEIGEPGGLLERRYLARLGAVIESAMGADLRANRYESWRA